MLTIRMYIYIMKKCERTGCEVMVRQAAGKIRGLIIRRRLLLSVILVAVAAAATALIFILSTLPSFQVEYKVSVHSVKDKTLKVSVRYKNYNVFSARTFELAEGQHEILEPECVDNEKKPVKFEEKDGIIKIGPVSSTSKYFDFTYVIPVGYGGKSGSQGALYDDLLAFSGEQVFLFPYFDARKEMKVSDRIRKISIQVDINKDWDSILPYSDISNRKQQAPVIIENPDWHTMYNLSKSCFAFGKFNKVPIKTKKNHFSILVDAGAKEAVSQDTTDAIGALYDYYNGLFGYGLTEYPVVLFRDNAVNQSKIISGVSGKSMGFSFNANSDKDWKALSHSLYTAFFDSRVKIRTLHYPPNLWLYKGLGTYYENASLDYLPEKIKTQFGLSSDAGLRELYSRYLYYRFKEPGVFKISPAEEGGALNAQLEYFHYTEAPIAIKTIDNIAAAAFGSSDTLLHTIIRNYSNSETLEVGKLMTEIVGTHEALIRSYLSGDTVMMYPGVLIGEESPSKVILQLDKYENLLYSWLMNELPGYPVDVVNLLQPKKVMEEVKKRRLKFATEEEEKLVSSFSPTVYVLLYQYALQADVCGEKDLKDPLLKFKLLNSKENVKKWDDFTKNMEVRIDDDANQVN